MTFADIHCHALCGVDDGSKSEEMMQQLIDAEYDEQVRYLCFTPHYHPGYYGNNESRAEESFSRAVEYCKQKHPDMQLLLANELHYSSECFSWLKSKTCRTLGGTRFVLVDFRENEEAGKIVQRTARLIGSGYKPILAHAERYFNLSLSNLKAMRQDGILIQVNCGSCLGKFGFRAKRQAKKLLALKMVDFISTDAHNLQDRAPQFLECYRMISKKYGTDYASYICRDHAVSLFFDKERNPN